MTEDRRIEIQGPRWRWGMWWWRIGGRLFNSGYAWTEQGAIKKAKRAMRWQEEEEAKERARKSYTIKVTDV